MGDKNDHLLVFFFPFLAQGHMIPTLDMAKLFASRGVRTAIITTPLNSSFVSKSIHRINTLGIQIQLHIINFPSTEAGLPEGCESLDKAVRSPDLMQNFFRATHMLKPQIDKLLQEHRPNCIIADTFFPWVTDLAANYKIPRLVFHGTCFFSLCAAANMITYQPFKKVSSDSEPFLIPNLPDEIKLTRGQVPGYLKQEIETEFIKTYRAGKEADVNSYGIVVNSFYELEPAYADYYRNVLLRKAWHIGPVSLCNKEAEDKAQRGLRLGTSIDEQHECFKWLDLQKPNSVIYISFGSLANFSDAQLRELAMGLEASGQQFIWVVKKVENDGENREWLPEEFEKRTEGKGLIIKGWAPQVLILDHEAVGGFLTHCGWNSTLEAVTAGVPMVTWPLSAEQFYNEKLVTEVLRIGVGVGSQQWGAKGGDSIKKEAIEKAVSRIMVGEEAEYMRNRAKGLGDTAGKAVEEGGSSYADLNRLIEELKLTI